MRDAGVPLLPGTQGVIQTLGDARSEAKKIGYPIMIKAAAGGGGRGMRIARDEPDLVRLVPLAQAEAMSAFGNGDIYLERFLERPRHVEVQVLGDHHGHLYAIGERDCSLQRRHQKLIEEAPAPNLPRKVRENLLRAAVKGAKAAGYTSAGTLEFLLDQDGHFYFMEMNTRIQVEHPVTELTTGDIDLVVWQIRIAAGERLELDSRALETTGHAIEVRITAEDSTRDFQPGVGVVKTWLAPGGPGIRVDSHLYSGYAIPPNYDSLLGKIIAHGKDRAEAIARLDRALAETVIEGVPSTINFHRQILADERFRKGDVHTGFLVEHFKRQEHEASST
jgi:acetyl-CoA carboxylase biotin carboxylase subunit